MLKHHFKTRIFHAVAALLVMGQLYSIYAVENKFFDKNIRFYLWKLHIYGGLTAFLVLFLFLIFIFRRNQGTPVSELFPWFSFTSLKNLILDIKRYVLEIVSFKIPEHKNPSPLASFLHGLGLFVMFVMASTGLFRFIVFQFDIEKTPFVKFIYKLHHVFADYAWIYLGLHVSVALINHIAKKQKISDMWSFKKNS